MNNKAFTITELLVTSVIILLIYGSAIGAYLIIQGTYQGWMTEYNMQRNVNLVMLRIQRGVREDTGIFGLRSAVSYTLPVVNPAASEIDFVGTDGNTRRYFLRNNNSIIYESPTQSPRQQTVYTVPAGSSITLQFWKPRSDGETVEVYLSVSKRTQNRNVSGSLLTYVNLRNMPK